MPEVDLDTHFASGGDRNVSCETQISTLNGSASAGPLLAKPSVSPESLHLPIRSEIHWVKLLDRGQSTIGHANPKSNRNSSKPKSVAPRLAITARASKPNGPIIVVPTKTKRSIFSGNSVRPVTNLWFFPRKIAVIDGEWKPAIADTVSPKASCFGSLFSNKENKASRRRSDSAAADMEVGKKVRPYSASFAAIVKYRGRHPANCGGIEEDCSADRSSEEGNLPADETAPEVPAMKRFSS